MDEKLSKRRLNEFEQKLRKLQRELQELKTLKRKVSRLRKGQARALDREVELDDLLDEFPGTEPEPRRPLDYRCRRGGCGSHDTELIEAGPRTIVICQACRGRYTLDRLAQAS